MSPFFQTEEATDAIVIHLRFDDAFAPLSQEWWEGSDIELLGFLSEAVERVEGENGRVVAVDDRHLLAWFAADELAAVDAASNVMDALAGSGAPRGRCGVGRGPMRFYRDAAARTVPRGPAVYRAAAIAAAAAQGAILLDASVTAGLAFEYLGSPRGQERAWEGVDWISAARELRRGPTLPPVVFHEFMWTGAALQDAPKPPVDATRRSGTVVGYDPAADSGVVEAGDGTRYRITLSRLVAPEHDPEPGDRVFFVVDDSERGPDGLVHAGAVIRMSEIVEGTVAKVFDSRHYAFVDVQDSRRNEQQLFMHADDNAWPVEVGDVVRFRVGENDRGAVVHEATVLDASD